MADRPEKSREDAPDGRPSSPLPQRPRITKADEPPIPQSKALQVFLLIALAITGTAYLVNEWTDFAAPRNHTADSTRLHQLVKVQSDFLEHTTAGQKALQKKQVEKAVSEFRLALQAQQTADAYQNLGDALLKAGNPDEAFTNFREAVRLNPRLMSAYYSWGQALTLQAKPEEAVAIYQQALERDSDSALIHYNLAVTLRQMQRNAEAAARTANADDKSKEATTDTDDAKRLAAQALQHYAAASHSGMASAEFWADYGELLNDQGNFSEAKTSLQRAVSENPKVASTQFQLALAQSHLGNYAETLAHYEKVLALTPDDPQTLNNLAFIYATATNDEVRSPKMAIQLATRACDATTDQNAPFMDTLARAYAADSNFFEAITWEDKAVKRATQLNNHELVGELQARYQLYLDHKTD
jgi:tetratricopeptide (TPR) repeat protein